MENNSVGSRLATVVDEITELEITKAQALYTKFQNSLKDKYEQSIKIIENDFIAKASLYGKKEEDCIVQKGAIISKYDEEFQKIYDSRRLQYISIQNEIQEMTANKLIVIANFKQIATSKAEFIKSNGYIDYLNQKQHFQDIVDTTLVKAEFDKYIKLLEELQDPLELYQKKLVALATKYDNYEAIILECEQKLNECIDAALNDFDEIGSYIENNLVVTKKQSAISKFLANILNKIGSNSKFEKNVVKKIENDLLEIDNDVSESVEIIEEQTINIIAAIEEIRENINLEFNAVVE